MEGQRFSLPGPYGNAHQKRLYIQLSIHSTYSIETQLNVYNH